jgi:sugar lactone lactonase YvrE
MMQPARKVNRKAQAPTAQPVQFPAPIGGWVENVNIATGGPGTARVMENIFPGVQGCRVRGGRQKVATVGARVKSMFTYQAGVTNRLFAATSAAIYDITGLNPTTVPTASVSGMASGYWSTVQMGTAGGEFLVAVNGTDTPRTFNGSSWATTSITGVTSSELSYVSKHKSRLWFVRKNSLTAWYLPVDSIAGAAADLSLTGVMQRGGSLMFIATWSQDTGDGQDDRIVFVSTEGEVAVYEGSNPASAADWSLVGLYNITKPLGPKCHFRAGGDLVIGTESGLVPLSAVTQKDPAAMDVSAMSAAIEQSWRDQVKRRTVDQPMELFKWPRENMLMVSLPHDLTTSFVANIQTGAWCKYIGWDVQAATIFNDQMYIGDRAGFVYAAEVGGADEGPATGGLFVPTVGNWDLSTAVYGGTSFSLSGQDASPTGVAFRLDGLKMYVVGDDNNRVFQYTLATAWNAGTASYDGVSFVVSSQDNFPADLAFSADGTKMYVVGNGTDTVYQYSLSTAWDISTASYSSIFFTISFFGVDVVGLAFSGDGTKMYVSHSATVYQYSLSTAWNISTASYSNKSFIVHVPGVAVTGVSFETGGTEMYFSVTGGVTNKVFQYSLLTAWDVSSASFSGREINLAPLGMAFPQGLTFKPDGTRMYIVAGVDSVFQYDLGTTSAPIALTGSPYICKLSYMPSDLGGTATEKTVGMIRARFLSSSPIAPQLSVATNYSVDFPPAPAATAIPVGGSLWGVARWGVSRWGSGDISAVRGTYDTGWISVGANGQVIAPQWQIVINGDGRPSAELLAIDVLIEPGGI